MNAQITLIVIGTFCLALAFGIKIGRLTYKAMQMKSKQNYDFQIKFHTDAHPIGKHGSIWVDCTAKGWKAEPIAFVFVNIPAAPRMNLDLMKKIWEEAEKAGYVPLALRDYIEVYGNINPPRANVAVRERTNTREQTIAAHNAARTAQKAEEKKAAQNAQAYEGSNQSASA